MEPFNKALGVVTDVMRDGATTHPDNDWIGRTPDYQSAGPKTICGCCTQVISSRIISPIASHGC